MRSLDFLKIKFQISFIIIWEEYLQKEKNDIKCFQGYVEWLRELKDLNPNKWIILSKKANFVWIVDSENEVLWEIIWFEK